MKIKMIDIVEAFTGAAEQFVADMASFLPKIFIAVIIWLIGKYLIDLALGLIKKINIKQLEWDKKIVDLIVKVVNPVGKIILILIILDYLGIGRTVIGALTNSLTLTLALALGISFGRALENDAKDIVQKAKETLKK